MHLNVPVARSSSYWRIGKCTKYINYISISQVERERERAVSKTRPNLHRLQQLEGPKARFLANSLAGSAFRSNRSCDRFDACSLLHDSCAKLIMHGQYEFTRAVYMAVTITRVSASMLRANVKGHSVYPSDLQRSLVRQWMSSLQRYEFVFSPEGANGASRRSG